MSEISWSPVDSGHIEAIAYDGSQDTMYVRFKSGAGYAYFGVDYSTYMGIKEASSVGKALSSSGLKGVRC